MSKAIEELEDELVEILRARREGERREEKIKMMIRRIKPDFVDLDIVEVLSKPLSEQLSSMNGKEKPYRSETGDPITMAQEEKQK
ncbi:hypothetical protein GTO10_00605 [Candidatus Saccharibacteria bacterium]|nr:hypothetical protein [Candidatus Saccharibacteria bacterium]